MWRSKGRILALSKDIRKKYEIVVLNVLLFYSCDLPLSGISTRLMLSEARDDQV